MCVILLIEAALFTYASVPNDMNTHGIVFKGNDYEVDARTSLVIGSKQLQWDGRGVLSLDFDLKITRYGDHYGYVCNLRVGDKHKISLILTNPKSSLPRLCVVGNDRHMYTLASESDSLDIYQWNRISLSMRNDGDSLLVSANDRPLFMMSRMDGVSPVTVTMGCCRDNDNPQIDVAPMEIRDISLTIGRSVYEFPLVKSEENASLYDTKSRIVAEIRNVEWIADEHSKWKPVMTLKFDQKTYPVAGSNSPNLYLVSGDRVAVVNLVKQRVVEYKYPSLIDMSRISNQFFIRHDETGREILCYYWIDENENNRSHVSCFDTSNGKWSEPLNNRVLSSYINNNRFLMHGDSIVVQMFGYGYHTFKNDYVTIDYEANVTRDTMLLRNISPRYMSAIGFMDDDKVAIYGGIGNDYGKQELGTFTYNDLYVLDVSSDSLYCVIENTQGTSDIAVSNMIYNSEENVFTALFFAPFKSYTPLTLCNIDMVTGEIVNITDSIPYYYNDMTSSSLLVQQQSVDKLYAVTVYKNPDAYNFLANIYSLHLPLLQPAENHEAVEKEKWIKIVAASLILLMLVCVTLWIKRRRQVISSNDSREKPLTAESIKDVDELTEDRDCVSIEEGNEVSTVETTHNDTAFERGTISFLGGFKVVDKEGENITGSFAPIVRQLLILIALYTRKNSAGISNVMLKDILWSDKSEESFINNRSVNVRKLRVFLENVGGIHLNVVHGNWTIDCDNLNIIDYYGALSVVNSINEKEHVINKGDIAALLKYATKGPLLPERHYEWIDSFKADYADNMIQTLKIVLQYLMVNNDNTTALKIADCILKFDAIDEDVVKAKCRLLMKSKRKGSAIKAYEIFIKEHKLMMDEDYPQSFNEFVEL